MSRRILEHLLDHGLNALHVLGLDEAQLEGCFQGVDHPPLLGALTHELKAAHGGGPIRAPVLDHEAHHSHVVRCRQSAPNPCGGPTPLEAQPSRFRRCAGPQGE